MLTSQSYLEAKCADSIKGSHALASTTDSIEVTVTRTLPADFPDMVRQFVGDTVTVIETQVWSLLESKSGRTGSMNISIAGAPAKIVAELQLEASATGSRININGNVKVSVPLVGGRVESAIIDHLANVTALEQNVGDAWLREN